MPDSNPFPGFLIFTFVFTALMISGGGFNPTSGMVILAAIYALSAYDQITAEIEYHREKRNFDVERILR